MICEIELNEFITAETIWCQHINAEDARDSSLRMADGEDERDNLRNSIIQKWALFKTCATNHKRNAQELLYEVNPNYYRCRLNNKS